MSAVRVSNQARMTATAHARKMGEDLPCWCFLLVIDAFPETREAYPLARLMLLDQCNEPAKADEHNGGSAGTVGRVALVREEVPRFAVHQKGVAIRAGNSVRPSAYGV